VVTDDRWSATGRASFGPAVARLRHGFGPANRSRLLGYSTFVRQKRFGVHLPKTNQESPVAAVEIDD